LRRNSNAESPGRKDNIFNLKECGIRYCIAWLLCYHVSGLIEKKGDKWDVMNYLEAAIKILEEAGRPLSFKQITAMALERDWIEEQGSDPSSVMNSLIMQDLKMKGTTSDFSRIGSGMFTLRKLVYRTTPKPEVKPRHERPQRGLKSKQTDHAPRAQKRSPPSKQPKTVRKTETEQRGMSPLSTNQKLQNQLKLLGTLLGYRVQEIDLSDGQTSCMGWRLNNNPELAFILWIRENFDMKKGITDLLALNYHKVIIIVSEGDVGNATVFMDNTDAKDRMDIISVNRLDELATDGIRFMEFYQRLRDCRPFRERGEFLENSLSQKES